MNKIILIILVCLLSGCATTKIKTDKEEVLMDPVWYYCTAPAIYNGVPLTTYFYIKVVDIHKLPKALSKGCILIRPGAPTTTPLLHWDYSQQPLIEETVDTLLKTE